MNTKIWFTKKFFFILFDSLGTKQIYVYGKIVRLLRIKFNWMFLFRDATRSRPMHECECNQTNEESSSRYRRTHNVQVSLITIYKWGVSHIDMVKSGKKAAAWPEFHTTWDVLFLPIKFVCVKQHNWKDFRDSSLQYSTCLSVCCYLHVCMFGRKRYATQTMRIDTLTMTLRFLPVRNVQCLMHADGNLPG